MKTLQDFIDYLYEQVRSHSIYVWGAQGQAAPTITEAWIRKRETSTANANRAVAFWKKQVAAGFGNVLKAFDCSGLGMYFIQNLTGLASSDMSANSMKGKCTSITRSQLRRGDWVFRVYTSGTTKGKAYHIGYVVDDKLQVIEAKGRDDGVVLRSLDASGTSYWNQYGRPSYFRAEIESNTAVPPSEAWTVTRALQLASPMLRGDDVKGLQTALNERGFNCGTADGIFGSKTETALLAYQLSAGTVDAVVAAKKTVTSLGGIYKGTV